MPRNERKGDAPPARRGRAVITPRPVGLTPLAAALGMAGLLAAAPVLAQVGVREAPETEVRVIGTVPLPGVGVDRDVLPYSTWTARPEDVERAQSATLPDLLNNRLPSVQLIETQGNLFQPEFAFRGFTASPLLGAPQGLSVFLDGMRMNQPFGDVVSFDLIPLNAIDRVTLITGSQPAFGQNTLGGALSLTTKSGRTLKDGEIDVTFGSFGRRALEFEQGGTFADGRQDWYIAGTRLQDDGWRRNSPSSINQLFGKWGIQDARGRFEVSGGWANNRLVGNGLLPLSQFRQDPRQVYTVPDVLRNTGGFVQALGTRFGQDGSELTAQLYVRTLRTRNIMGDVNQIEFGDVEPYEEELGDYFGASVNRMRIKQDTVGGGLQWARGDERGAGGRTILGTSFDSSRLDLFRTFQLGDFVGRTGVADPTFPETAINSLDGRTRTVSLYATHLRPIGAGFTLTTSARWNHTTVSVSDRLGTALDGDHHFSAINPSIGLAKQLTPSTNVFAGWGRGSRAPTPIELGCADPARPCLLPTAMQADPPLNKVVTDTFELGARGRQGSVSWQATVFTANSKDDILFVAAPIGQSFGYFTNFGRTRRQGLELLASGKLGPALDWSAGYTLLDATFRSDASIPSPNNSSADEDGNIAVRKGNRLPGLARHAVKAGLDWRPMDRLLLGSQLVVFSDRTIRGNENGGQAENGRVPGFGIFNLYGRFQLAKRVELFARVNNVFDKRYATGGTIGENAFTGGSFQRLPTDGSQSWPAETFVAPGSPRAVFAGVRVSL